MKDLERLAELPGIMAGKGIYQNRSHEFDVFYHTLSVASNLRLFSNDRNLIASAYLHDIGKPPCASPQKNRGKLIYGPNGRLFHNFGNNHEGVGKSIVLALEPRIFRGLGLDQQKIANFVGAHLIPAEGIKKLRKTKNYEEFIRMYQNFRLDMISSHINMIQLMSLFLADCLGKGKGCIDREELILIRKSLSLIKNKEILKKIYNIQRENAEQGLEGYSPKLYHR